MKRFISSLNQLRIRVLTSFGVLPKDLPGWWFGYVIMLYLLIAVAFLVFVVSLYLR